MGASKVVYSPRVLLHTLSCDLLNKKITVKKKLSSNLALIREHFYIGGLKKSKITTPANRDNKKIQERLRELLKPTVKNRNN